MLYMPSQVSLLRCIIHDLRSYVRSLRRRAVLDKKYENSPEIRALVHRPDLEIDSFEITTIGAGASLGRFCSLRDHATSQSSRSIAIGKECWIGPAVELAVWDNHHLCLKGDTSVGGGTKIYGSVTIEKYCLLSANLLISSGNHHANHVPSRLIKDQDTLFAGCDEPSRGDMPIHIEEDCWIGWGAFLKQGGLRGTGRRYWNAFSGVERCPPIFHSSWSTKPRD